VIYLLAMLLAGLVFGTLLRKKRSGLNEERWIFAPLILLIFFMGASIGASPDVKSSAALIGYQSVVFAILTVLGSALGAILLRRIFRD